VKVALVDHTAGGATRELAEALRADLVAARGAPGAEALLRKRGFTAALTHVPLAVAALARGGYDVAHAFTPTDALAALTWRRVHGGGVVVYTLAGPVGRDTLADRRLALRLLERALAEGDAVLAADDAARDAARRWLALDVPVLDAAGHERLYRELLARG
jgi:hypothetical protein